MVGGIKICQGGGLGRGEEQIFGYLGGLLLSPGRENPDDSILHNFNWMFYIRINKNSKHDTLKQISLCSIWNTLGRPEHPVMGIPPMSEQDTLHVCMNQFLASMEIYPHTKYSAS